MKQINSNGELLKYLSLKKKSQISPKILKESSKDNS
jgi:hypothetical protein